MREGWYVRKEERAGWEVRERLLPLQDERHLLSLSGLIDWLDS